jgi:hypothetical protein
MSTRPNLSRSTCVLKAAICSTHSRSRCRSQFHRLSILAPWMRVAGYGMAIAAVAQSARLPWYLGIDTWLVRRKQ